MQRSGACSRILTAAKSVSLHDDGLVNDDDGESDAASGEKFKMILFTLALIFHLLLPIIHTRVSPWMLPALLSHKSNLLHSKIPPVVCNEFDIFMVDVIRELEEEFSLDSCRDGV